MSNNLYKLSDVVFQNLIGNMPSNKKLDVINYNVWYLKVQFTLNEGDMLDFLTTSMPL